MPFNITRLYGLSNTKELLQIRWGLGMAGDINAIGLRNSAIRCQQEAAVVGWQSRSQSLLERRNLAFSKLWPCV